MCGREAADTRVHSENLCMHQKQQRCKRWKERGGGTHQVLPRVRACRIRSPSTTPATSAQAKQMLPKATFMLTSALLRRNQLSSCTAHGRGASTLEWLLYRKRGTADQAVIVDSFSQYVAVLMDCLCFHFRVPQRKQPLATS